MHMNAHMVKTPVINVLSLSYGTDDACFLCCINASVAKLSDAASRSLR